MRRRSSFHSHCKPCFLWLLELKCRSSKKQGWVGAPTSSLASRFLRRRSWGCVTGFCPTVGLLEEPKERLRLMLPRLLRPWVLTGHSYGACCNHVNSSQPLSLKIWIGVLEIRRRLYGETLSLEKGSPSQARAKGPTGYADHPSNRANLFLVYTVCQVV